MKITDVTLTLFSWESIPLTIYGHHTARPTGMSDLGLLAITTDDGLVGHAFLGTSSNPASLDGPGLGAQIDFDLIERKKVGVLS